MAPLLVPKRFERLPDYRTLQRQLGRFFLRQRLPRLAQNTCRLYLGSDGGDGQAACREILHTQLILSSGNLYRLLETDLGQALLSRLEELIQLPAEKSQRQRLLRQLADADSLSLMELIQQLSGGLRTDRLLQTARQIEQLLHSTQALLQLVEQLAQKEDIAADASPPIDPRLPGPYGVERRILGLKRPQSSAERFYCFIYQPLAPQPERIPAVIVSHGLAAHPRDLATYAIHLASHGYLVAVPQHRGSDAQQVNNVLAGGSDEIFALQEFFDRPRDVTAVLDALTQENKQRYGDRLQLDRVGILGKSFGGYTALALAGAAIDFVALNQRCNQLTSSLNLSLFLQCQALALPNTPAALGDSRIQAVFALAPIGSGLFSRESLQAVTVPTIVATGSGDKAAPMALEPLQLFPHLASAERFLAVIRGKSHVGNVEQFLNNLQLTTAPGLSTLQLTPPIIDSYLLGLSLLFFNRYLSDAPPKLTLPAYARHVSQPPYEFHVVGAGASQALAPVVQQFRQRLLDLDWQSSPSQYEDGMFTVGDGLSLYYQSWRPSKPPRAVLVLLHGLGGHSGLFQTMVKSMVPAGHAMYGYDLRGHGRSPGQRGHISRWSDYRDDLAHFLTMVQQQHPGVPCFLVGHSLGGIIALEYLVQHWAKAPDTAPIRGAVVAALPFNTHSATSLRMRLGQLLSSCWPRFSLPLGLAHVLPSRDRSVVLAYAHDRLRHQRGSARLATEFLGALRRIHQGQARLSLPVLMLHGTADQVSSLEASQTFFQRLSGPGKRWRAYPGAYHELFNEINHQEIFSDISQWIEEQI